MMRFAAFATVLTLATALEDVSDDFYAESEQAGRGVSNATMQGVLLTEAAQKTGAVCLDGSPAMVYVRKGVGDGANKWYIHHQGGGWCESLDDCLGRSKGGLGSSKGYQKTSAQNGGYFSTSPVDNPMMYNWNSVFMPYCDGGSFSGNNDTVQPYKGATLHWRGKRIREAVYEELITNHGLKSATDVVISGCSAGGLATFLHTDQWCDALAAEAEGVKCVGMPDSGFFLDYQAADVPETPPSPPTSISDSFTSRRVLSTLPGDYHAGLKWCFETFNASAGVNPACIEAHHTGGPATDDPDWLCMFAEHSAAFTHTPIFPLQSEYDAWQTGHVLKHGNDPAVVNLMGKNITERMQANIFTNHPDSGAFLDSCHHHCGAWNSIRIDGDLVSVAMQKWYEGIGKEGSKKVWNQGKPYPCADCCKP